MAYKKSSSCGGLRYNTSDFTEVDGVLTAAGNTELVGDPFLASMCGDIWFDDGVFGEVGRVITTAETTVVENSFAANCSLLFDKNKFEIGEDKEIMLVVPPMPNYLCFTAEEVGSTISMSNSDGYAPEVSLETSINGVDWTPFVVGDTTITLENVGDKVYFRGDNESMAGYNEDDDDYYGNTFVMTGKIAASGNVMSLLDKTCESVTIGSEYCFGWLFISCTSLTTAPELPATTLADYCYYYMFNGCTSLTTAPELPATTLVDYCYNSMFQGCTSLTTAPELPATTLANYCYSNMFEGCTSLTTPPELPATTLTANCYECMFSNCTSLTTAPELPATTLTIYCYNGMFDGCTSLTTTPELPATTLGENCYSGMFAGCTSLTTVPELPATTLANYCYCYMFNGCTSLYVSDSSGDGYDKEWNIPTVGVANGDYVMDDMFVNCLGTRSTDSPNFNGVQKTYYTQNVPV